MPLHGGVVKNGQWLTAECDVSLDDALVSLQEPEHGSEQHRLAGCRLADDAEDLSFVERQTEIVEGGDGAEA